MVSKKKETGVHGKVVCTNKKAYHEYFIVDTLETGIILQGQEVKSIRAGKANLKDGYANIKNGEMFLYNVHISHYAFATTSTEEPLRVRKLLLHKNEIKKLTGKIQEKGIALVPLKIYFKANGKAKVLLGLAKGKKQYDKRASLKERENERELRRLNKGNRYSSNQD
jgi:SsrA-binding protein